MKANTWQQLALHYLHQSKARYEAHEEAERLWYQHGDGLPTSKGGRGHSYPYCIHGVSRWVDYDCACGPCEDGDGYWDYLRELAYARDAAQRAFDEFQRRMSLIVQVSTELHNNGAPFLIKYAETDEWLIEPIRMAA